MATKKKAVKARGASRAALKKSPRKAPRAAKTTAAPGIKLALPRIGAHWPAQSGTFMGLVRGDQGQPDYALIARIEGADAIKGQWGPTRKVGGALSHYDGLANTKAMAAAGSDIAKQALAFKSGSHRDFYIASRHEARIIAANANGLLGKSWLWTSTQDASDDDYAWLQDFGNGSQFNDPKSHSYGVVLVRRLPIQ